MRNYYDSNYKTLENYNFILLISDKVIQEAIIPYHILSIAKGVIFFGCFKKIRIQ